MREMGWSWEQLERTPDLVVEQAIEFLELEGEVAKINTPL